MIDNRTATVFIHESILFEMLGLKFLDASIVSIEVKHYGIEMKIKGNDERIPEGIDYPDSVIILKTVQGHIEKTDNSFDNSGV